MGCLDSDMLPVVDSLNAGFCANLYSEAEDIAKQGLPEKRKDFFMEIREFMQTFILVDMPSCSPHLEGITNRYPDDHHDIQHGF